MPWIIDLNGARRFRGDFVFKLLFEVKWLVITSGLEAHPRARIVTANSNNSKRPATTNFKFNFKLIIRHRCRFGNKLIKLAAEIIDWIIGDDLNHRRRWWITTPCGGKSETTHGNNYRFLSLGSGHVLCRERAAADVVRKMKIDKKAEKVAVASMPKSSALCFIDRKSYANFPELF